MDADEQDIFNYLKDRGEMYVNGKEISRRAAGRKRFADDPEWAKGVLTRMLERGILESNQSGHFRIKPISRKDKRNRWVSPEIAKILSENGVGLDKTETAGTDEYYDSL